jgi:hypothetical protein
MHQVLQPANRGGIGLAALYHGTQHHGKMYRRHKLARLGDVLHIVFQQIEGFVNITTRHKCSARGGGDLTSDAAVPLSSAAEGSHGII